MALAKRLLLAGVEVIEMEEDNPTESQLDRNGHEIPDPTPIAPPVGFQDPPTLEELIRTMVNNAAIQARLDAEGAETFEEADDFDVADDDQFEPSSRYEGNFDHLSESPEAAVKRLQDAEAAAAAPPLPPPPEAPPAGD